LKIGILIIGSLFWEKGKKDIREKWRDNRLLKDDAVEVCAPVRYGKIADTRDKTYTMVLSMKAPEGRAKVVPCINPVVAFSGLLKEAVELWTVEAQVESNRAVSAGWGCVALKIRDGVSCPDDISTKWAQIAKQNERQFNIQHATDETALVNNEGVLQIPWPVKPDGQPLTEVDALLCTTNQPSLAPDYADPFDIARAWLRSPENDYYFWENRKHGLKTFQDEEILDHIWRAHPGGCGGPTC